MQDWNEPQHYWPSNELIGSLNPVDNQAMRRSLVSAVWNSLSAFGSIAVMVEGGYIPVADNKGELHEFFADRICPAVGLEPKSEASAAFGKMLMRDLAYSISTTAQHYGPPQGYHSAYFTLDTHNELMCQADIPHMKRRILPVVMSAQKVA